ncbi:hypothetical protein [Lacrimispora celerecrescens]|uniref:Cell wall-binding protein n=1 Tax=Lacrimispora celerecrescens TaxID=29354 RepID=A0A084JQD1_9FIRM|nr:hypothetical protein [Lacrimispora celerecrescens]KEZ91165.1 hypothetical protein IO98_05325 [Lacrimispora celerecrescens]
MKKRFKKLTTFSGILALAILGSTMTSYAKAKLSYSWANETTVTISATEAQAMGYWNKSDRNRWNFLKYENDFPVANAYIESFTEPGVFYFVQTDGNMLINDIHDGYIYGEDGKRGAATDAKYFTYNSDLASRIGHWVENDYGWIFINNSTGDSITEAWVENEPGIYYFLMENGVMQTSKNRNEGKTPDGYVVNTDGKWCKPN